MEISGCSYEFIHVPSQHTINLFGFMMVFAAMVVMFLRRAIKQVRIKR